MELGMREWMLLIGALLILLVLADGVRRVIQDRRSNMRMKVASKDPIDDYLSELPNGGARVVSDSKDTAADSLSLDNKRKKALASTIEDDLAADFVFNPPVEDNAAVESVSSIAAPINPSQPSTVSSDPTPSKEQSPDLVPELLSSAEQTLQQVVDSDDMTDKIDDVSADLGTSSDAIFDQMLAQVEQDVRDNLSVPEVSEVHAEPIKTEPIKPELDDTVDDLPSLKDIDLELSNDVDEDAADSRVIADESDVTVGNDIEITDVIVESDQNNASNNSEPQTVIAQGDLNDDERATDSILAKIEESDQQQSELDVGQSQVTAETLYENLSLSSQPGKQEAAATSQQKKYRSNPFKVPEQQSFDLGDGSVPMLIDSVAKDEDEVVDLAEQTGFVPRKTPKKSVRKVTESVEVPPAIEAERSTDRSKPAIAKEETTAGEETTLSPAVEAGRETVIADEVEDAAPANDPKVTSEATVISNTKTANKTLLDRLADIPVFGKPSAVVQPPSDDSNDSDGFEEPSVADYQHVQIINVRAKATAGFDADKLHGFFKACDIQLNRHKVYQRNEQANGKGAIEFNVANQVQSGIFMAEEEGKLVIPGVSFYLGLPGPADPLAALEAMIQTAEYVANNFDGVMKDKDGSDINKQVLDYFRQDIKEFSRKHLAESS
ncbi:Cell division protein ZipA [Sinobacterium norvegicum]|uniref:Cell division protein ZipA n=1 Tax=Sinobacterium norvegicum TaxID=1641715 RepID=A0ABN8EEH5_9GAMM|nr:cell division protein ZipA C-terminal FtsZ-binding domain-containing protein [Sinobacterium norvegicum]CAH0990379.1 Cell division protein ZipA [Sinobacterium norvegicum]